MWKTQSTNWAKALLKWQVSRTHLHNAGCVDRLQKSIVEAQVTNEEAKQMQRQFKLKPHPKALKHADLENVSISFRDLFVEGLGFATSTPGGGGASSSSNWGLGEDSGHGIQ